MNTDEIMIMNRLARVQQRVWNACIANQRAPESVRLLLATKTVPADRIRVALKSGVRLIGENKVQEFREKAAALADLNYERHFIGHLQTNKVKELLQYVTCIQSVDRIALVQELDKRLQAAGHSLDIMLQVNTSYEASKFGLDPQAVPAFVKEVAQYDTLRIKGLMTIGLFDADAEKVRPSFRLLRALREQVQGIVADPDSVQELSMGMSGDLETAIAEGATLIRVGTAVFGQRRYADQYYWNENNTIS